MERFEHLVKALRCKRDDCEGCDLAFFDKDEGWMCRYAAKDDDAADAIEALQAEKKKTVTQIYYEEQMEWEGRCRELMYWIADLQEQLSKRGEIVRCKDCKWSRSCGYISTRSYKEWKDWFCADGEREVQE